MKSVRMYQVIVDLLLGIALCLKGIVENTFLQSKNAQAVNKKNDQWEYVKQGIDEAISE
ncbi:hypothetical protein [Sunxiuqinia elliptica]|uniref:Uncharacterized protein n=1 Tax=Sunxiuqinia elliptica TaxID=655355 RepID=A0A4R6H762_9BACT|nr:hypothetical protein [Sunxiuqinia elliptica]TDO04060.1 hypothetical protein DET52_102400 [Sunxiuqinia elliptica]TDO62342.1 hypothetical protein DET65_2077 [Sunxiuqinia elliptica]